MKKLKRKTYCIRYSCPGCATYYSVFVSKAEELIKVVFFGCGHSPTQLKFEGLAVIIKNKPTVQLCRSHPASKNAERRFAKVVCARAARIEQLMKAQLHGNYA